MAKFLINNGKPTIIYKGSPEWERRVSRPLDRRGRPVELPYEAEEKRQFILNLGKDRKFGEPIEIPAIIPPFECGEPEYRIDPKDPTKRIADTSKIRKYPQWLPGEIRKFENEMDAIEIMMRYRFVDECDEQGNIIKKNREGAKYHELVDEEETKKILEAQEKKWQARVREAERSGIV